MKGATYRVRYNSSARTTRSCIAIFMGLTDDPLVINPETGKRDKQAMHFELTTPVIYDEDTKKEYIIQMPPSETIRFDLWHEDLIDYTMLVMGM